MQKQRLFRWVYFTLGIGLACFSLIYYRLYTQMDIVVQDRPGQGVPQIGGDFILTDHHGSRRSSLEFRGKYMLVYFGYSFCPDICPLGLENISGALRALGRDLSDVAPIFITVDPDRDTAGNLKIYSGNFHPKLLMLTGTPYEIATVLKSYKVYAAKVKPDGTMADYLMDHSTLIYFMDRQGHFLKSFPHTIAPEELARAIILILTDDKKRR